MSSVIPTGIYPGISAPSATLKRARSIGNYQRKFNGQRLPLLPRINSDLLLQVYTHKSLRRPNVPPADYGDNERLACLGKSVFDLAITSVLFQRRPLLKDVDISVSPFMNYDIDLELMLSAIRNVEKRCLLAP